MTWTADNCVAHVEGMAETTTMLVDYLDADRLIAEIAAGALGTVHMFAFSMPGHALQRFVCESYSPAPEVTALVREHGARVLEAWRVPLDRTNALAAELRTRGHAQLGIDAEEAADGLAFWLGTFVHARLGDAELGRQMAKQGGVYRYSFLDVVNHSDTALLNALSDLIVAKSPTEDDISYMVEHYLIDADNQLSWEMYSVAAFHADLAARIAPRLIEPRLMLLTALAGEYTANGRKPTADEIREIEDAHQTLLACCADSGAVGAFVADHERRPESWAAATLARAYVQGDRLLEARRLLKETTRRYVGEDHPVSLDDELHAVLFQVNDALAEQVEHSGYRAPGLADLSQEMQDGFRAIVRRLELQTQLGARELSVAGVSELLTRLSEQIGRQGAEYPAREADTHQRLAGEFGALWDSLRGPARKRLVTVETLYADMAPSESGEPATLLGLYTTLVETLLREACGLRRERVTFGDLVERLAQLASPATFQPTSPGEQRIRDAITSQPLVAQQGFWTRELPTTLRRPDLNVVNLRNRAVHHGEASWDDVRRLREMFLGTRDAPGLILRMLEAKQA